MASSRASVPEGHADAELALAVRRHVLFKLGDFGAKDEALAGTDPLYGRERLGSFKVAYCGFRSSRGTCVVDIVIAVTIRCTSLIDSHPLHTAVAASRRVDLLPQTPPLAGLANESEKGRMGTFLLCRAQ